MTEMPVLAIGKLKFGVKAAAFAELTRASEYRWEAQTRIANDPALQFCGYGVETLTLPLVVYPQADASGGGGDAATLSRLREMADAGQPQMLVGATGSAEGASYGLWVIKGISEKQSAFLPNGTARKIEFEVTLHRYSR